ncbi:mannose-6-phosphate isomerase, class I [Neolewinella agarilytica]|uniref:mannose-6-phosphate isomerase n=1 Tax=Neolewinella agarilytica TaxID=478744 RepID=A0A1H9GPQ5_9BACT|nr:mannose-6-phosphate isomerase, class I [Neolewinella agarilytica]SEQ51969.1 mannose-6-phosphate isomerase, type 1 [Neolewinella agarilytica]
MRNTSATYLEGTLQHYDWGGYDYLATLTGKKMLKGKTTAELWLGDHPRAPARVLGQELSLRDLIRANPVKSLGETISHRYGDRLPFLFKVLDVREMLSIQVHPNKAAAERGFAREEACGPERTAPNRNYRDDNHKPELGVALTDFYLLHGFRDEECIAWTLQKVPGWEALQPILRKGGVQQLYEFVMSAEQSVVDRLLQPLIDSLPPYEKTSKEDIAHWIHKAVKKYSQEQHHDRGIFSICWFNIVHLLPGQAIYQDAGVPHAYLEGICVEIMANSDNVLRCGLTPKYIDVPELLAHISFCPVRPKLLTASETEEDWRIYPTPAPDFQLAVATPRAGKTLLLDTLRGPSVLFLLEGCLIEEGEGVKLDLSNRAVFVPAGSTILFQVKENTKVYRASPGKL